MKSWQGKSTKDEPFSVASHPNRKSIIRGGCGSLPVLATGGTQCFSYTKVNKVNGGAGLTQQWITDVIRVASH